MKFEFDATILLAFMLMQLVSGLYQALHSRDVARSVNEIRATIDRASEVCAR